MTSKQLLDRASTVLSSLPSYYNDQGEYVEGEGDILADFVAYTLIKDYDASPDRRDREIIYYLTGIFEQAMDDLAKVCQALETWDVTT